MDMLGPVFYGISTREEACMETYWNVPMIFGNRNHPDVLFRGTSEDFRGCVFDGGDPYWVHRTEVQFFVARGYRIENAPARWSRPRDHYLTGR